jgi:hypothetical protein
MFRILADALMLATRMRPMNRDLDQRFPSRRPDRPSWEAPDHWMR